MTGFYGAVDGTGSAARFSNPNGVAVDNAGNIYVADFYFNTIRKGYPPPKIFNFGFIGGQFRFDLTGPTGQVVVVETSPDLVSWFVSGDVLIAVVSTVASDIPPCARASLIAASPGVSRAPETIAAIVSRMRCFVSRATSGGSARLRADAM